jgi:hypothetical protein
LSLAADLGSATTIDLVPGHVEPDAIGDLVIFSGSLWIEGGAFGGTHLLTGTITAVPEPSVMAFLVLLLLGATYTQKWKPWNEMEICGEPGMKPYRH